MRKTALLVCLLTVAILTLPTLAQGGKADFARTTRPLSTGDDDSNDPQPVIVVNLPDVQDVMGSVAVRYFDRMEQQGELDPVTARRAKKAVFERMMDLGLKPADIAPPSDF